MTTLLAVLTCLAAVPTQEPQASAPPAADPKLVAVVEQNKGSFEGCMADAAQTYTVEDPKLAKEKAKLEAKKDKSLKDLQRQMEIMKKEAETLSNLIKANEACEDALDELASAKLKEAGAGEAAAAAALAQWKQKWFAAHP